MSANNQLIILKKKQFEVHINLCVDNEFKPAPRTLLKTLKTLKQAIIFANKFCREEMIEYGYHIDGSCLM